MCPSINILTSVALLEMVSQSAGSRSDPARARFSHTPETAPQTNGLPQTEKAEPGVAAPNGSEANCNDKKVDDNFLNYFKLPNIAPM